MNIRKKILQTAGAGALLALIVGVVPRLNCCWRIAALSRPDASGWVIQWFSGAAGLDFLRLAASLRYAHLHARRWLVYPGVARTGDAGAEAVRQ